MTLMDLPIAKALTGQAVEDGQAIIRFSSQRIRFTPPSLQYRSTVK